MSLLLAAVCHPSEQQVCQISSVDACSIGWRIIDQTSLSITPCTPTLFLIQQSYIIITIRCWFVRMCTR